MKKIITSIMVVAVFMLFSVNVFAAGGISVSPGSLSIEAGSSKTFRITATNTIGDVSISSSNTSVARVSTGSWGTGMVEEGQTKSTTITVTGVSAGSATITIVIDAATFDGEDLAGQRRTVTVNVVAKPTPPPTTPTTPTNPTNPTTPKTPTTPTQTPTSNLSTNNKLKDISVEGYKLVKVNSNNYTLEVTNNVASIKLKGEAEDSKAKVEGLGNHELKTGENNIEVTVTSESGAKNKIKIKITRKDAFYIADLDYVLNSKETYDIVIKENDKLSSQDITKIINSKKTIKFNYNNKDKKVLYSWSLDGNKIKAFNELITGIDFNSKSSKEISKLSNYADGLCFSMKHKSSLSSGIKVRLYVGDKYSNTDIVNVYYYNSSENKLETVKEGIAVSDGYVEFEAEKSSECFVTMSTVKNVIEKVSLQEPSNNMLIIAAMALQIVIILTVVIYLIKKKKKTAI